MTVHSSHKCSNIDRVADDLHRQTTDGVDNIAAGVDGCKNMVERLEKEKNDFTEQVAYAKVNSVRKLIS